MLPPSLEAGSVCETMMPGGKSKTRGAHEEALRGFNIGLEPAQCAGCHAAILRVVAINFFADGGACAYACH
jgi:hypothetical protein